VYGHVLRRADEAAAKSISSKELQYVQQLMAEYEAAEAATTTGTGATASSSRQAQQQQQHAAAATAAAASDAAGDGEGGSWVGEGYEEDQLRGVERGYLKFSKRLARQPQQCAR
jgi:hypothetical protein